MMCPTPSFCVHASRIIRKYILTLAIRGGTVCVLGDVWWLAKLFGLRYRDVCCLLADPHSHGLICSQADADAAADALPDAGSDSGPDAAPTQVPVHESNVADSPRV